MSYIQWGYVSMKIIIDHRTHFNIDSIWKIWKVQFVCKMNKFGIFQSTDNIRQYLLHFTIQDD